MEPKFKPETTSKLPDAMQILRASQLSIIDIDNAVKDWDKSFPEYAGLLAALPTPEPQSIQAQGIQDIGGD